MNIKEYLSHDLVRFSLKKPSLVDFIISNEVWYIYHYIRHMRYVEYYREKKSIIPRILYYYHFFLYKRLGFILHFEIYPGSVGPGFRIYHSGSFTHVGKNVKIGKNCTMLPGVVFGNKTEAEDNQEVIVGNDCYIGLNVVLLGGLHIGNNVTIGANSVVTKDIPDNVVVAGAPAVIIKQKQ